MGTGRRGHEEIRVIGYNAVDISNADSMQGLLVPGTLLSPCIQRARELSLDILTHRKDDAPEEIQPL